MTWLLVTVLFLVLAGVYTSWTAGRLDRLHARVDAAWAGLDAALVRRAAAARTVAAHLPDSAEARALDSAATQALDGGPVGREAVENALTLALRHAVPHLGEDPEATAARQELLTAATRVAYARSFHNSAVADTVARRRRRFPRALRLAGHRAMPRHFDIDDEPFGHPA